MSSKHSYKITLSNNKTEKQAIDYLMEANSDFLLPTKESRKYILEALGLDKKYIRTFDLFMMPNITNLKSEVTINNVQEIVLVELKTTQKYLPESPKGFFFGATKNEFDLAEKLGIRYKFCFVSLHPDSLSYKLLTLSELNKLILNKRTQYQINL